MTNKHRIVVSAENNPYAAWMAKLFYYSCVTRLNHSPIIMVHAMGGEWQRDFCDLVRFGATVRSAPSYAVSSHGDVYPPRNTPGTLLHAAEHCSEQDEFIVLCDPDMIFMTKPEFPTTLSADHYAYMDYERPEVESTRERLGIARETISTQKKELCCGVPYVIPVAEARRIANAWLETLDLFPPRGWEDVMYAFGLTIVKLGLKIESTNFISFNNRHSNLSSGQVIHYCYGDDSWNKRFYLTEEQARNVWDPQVEAPRETVLGEILTQIREARDFYTEFYF